MKPDDNLIYRFSRPTGETVDFELVIMENYFDSIVVSHKAIVMIRETGRRRCNPHHIGSVPINLDAPGSNSGDNVVPIGLRGRTGKY